MSSLRPLVLVVDDGRQHVTLLRLALMQRGYAVIVVHSIEGARTMARERPLDAVIATLPFDGLLEALAEDRPPVAAAVVTREADVDAASAAGFDLTFLRPIDFAELDVSLRDRMKRRVSGTRTKAVVVDDATRSKRAAAR